MSSDELEQKVAGEFGPYFNCLDIWGYNDRLRVWKALLAARAEIARLSQSLADAANEIHCAGPVDHRIRVVRAEWSEALEKKEARVRELELDLAAVLVVLRSKSTDQEWEGMPVGFREAYAASQEKKNAITGN